MSLFRNKIFTHGITILIIYGVIPLYGCSLERVSQKGYIYQFASNSSTTPGSLTVKVRPRNDLFANIDASDFLIDEKTSLFSAPFQIQDIVNKRAYIFEISGNFHPTLSFPVTIGTKPFILGAFESALYATIVNNASLPPYNTDIRSEGVGTIIALTNPFRLPASLCGQIIDRVSLIEKDSGEPVGGDLKYFYFTSSGSVGLSFTPQFENFIIFNVPEGSYTLKYLTIDSSASYIHEVVIVSGYVSLGYQLPCQNFETFDEFLK